MEGLFLRKIKKERKNNKSQNLREAINTTKYAINFLKKEKGGKLYLFFKGLKAIFNAIFPFIYAVIPGMIINELTGKQNIYNLIIYVGTLTFAPVINQFINTIANIRLTKIKDRLFLKFEAKFYDNISDMDYETLEKPDIQIKKDRSHNSIKDLFGVIDQLSGLILAIISFSASSLIIITLNPLIIILIIVIVYINSIVTKKENYKIHLFNKELSKHDRYRWGNSHMLEHFNYAKELRLFNIKSLLIEMYSEEKMEADKLGLKTFSLVLRLNIFKSFTNFIQQICLYGILIFMVIEKGLPVGDMTIYLTTATLFSNSLNNIFVSYLGINKLGLSINEMKEFDEILNNQHKSGSIVPIFNDNSIIEFRNVSFRYPGSNNYALKDVNIVLKGKEKLCIVGINGSGKSTFIKLLIGLYFPTEGEILLNGININEYDYKKYQRLFAPVFQDFVRYYMNLGMNIALNKKYDKNKIDKISKNTGLTSLVKKLPKGYDTQVNKLKDEEGFNPSGGEDQRIAIARACYHGGDIYILDEPTAALDPMAEYEIYSQFNDLITKKTAVLVTHRLSAVQLADTVAVFDNGSIIEYGTHKVLYEKRGVYTDMFDKQSEFYRKNE